MTNDRIFRVLVLMLLAVCLCICLGACKQKEEQSGEEPPSGTVSEPSKETPAGGDDPKLEGDTYRY